MRPCPIIPFRFRCLAVATAAAFAPFTTTPFAQESRNLEAPAVDVVGTTPVPGLGSPKNEVPANVQILTPQDIKQQRPLDLPDLLDSTTQSVNVNNIQGNPYQPQVNYRGFGASPLLGEPVGLSVFQDGVRINEPFGDVVQWDLIPTGALATVDVIPGSNPLFGLNTLGGALALRTKTGAAFPGTAVQAYGGSFGREERTDSNRAATSTTASTITSTATTSTRTAGATFRRARSTSSSPRWDGNRAGLTSICRSRGYAAISRAMD